MTLTVARTATKALFACLVIGSAAAAVVVASPGDGTRPAAGGAAFEAAALTTGQLIGQRIVTGYNGTKPPRSVLRAARDGRIGGVILFSNNMPTPGVAKRAITRLQRWAKAGGMPPLFVMIDQEGGIVQRLPTLPPRRSPQSIGRSSNPARTAGSQGLATGRALKRHGFNVNLAPVVDVPRVKNSFLGNRAYSRNPGVVAGAGCAFAAGNERGGVAAAFKHFPGLGRAGADTDFSDVTIDATPSALRADWAAYRNCPRTPTFVMLASARYPRLGLDRPASLERQTYRLLEETGFSGLTITDALETPQFDGRVNAARSALKAGADVLLWGQAWRVAMRARTRLLSDARARRLTRSQLLLGAERIIAVKQRIAG